MFFCFHVTQTSSSSRVLLNKGESWLMNNCFIEWSHYQLHIDCFIQMYCTARGVLKITEISHKNTCGATHFY